MGQAYDDQGNLLGAAIGRTKKDVFDKLMAAHPEAAELRIKKLPEICDSCGHSMSYHFCSVNGKVKCLMASHPLADNFQCDCLDYCSQAGEHKKKQRTKRDKELSDAMDRLVQSVVLVKEEGKTNAE